MAEYQRFERYRFSSFSNCTPVQLEKRARQLRRAWRALHQARSRLARDKRLWLGAAPRPSDPARPFCFVLRRMKRTWRDADRAADLAGLAVHRTVGSTDARKEWFLILSRTLDRDEVVRIRHRSHDEPVVIMRESRFRTLERAADSTACLRSAGGLTVPPPADIRH